MVLLAMVVCVAGLCIYFLKYPGFFDIPIPSLGSAEAASSFDTGKRKSLAPWHQPDIYVNGGLLNRMLFY